MNTREFKEYFEEYMDGIPDTDEPNTPSITVLSNVLFETWSSYIYIKA